MNDCRDENKLLLIVYAACGTPFERRIFAHCPRAAFASIYLFSTMFVSSKDVRVAFLISSGGVLPLGFGILNKLHNGRYCLS